MGKRKVQRRPKDTPVMDFEEPARPQTKNIAPEVPLMLRRTPLAWYCIGCGFGGLDRALGHDCDDDASALRARLRAIRR